MGERCGLRVLSGLGKKGVEAVEQEKNWLVDKWKQEAE
jgi:hypothetical protein